MTSTMSTGTPTTALIQVLIGTGRFNALLVIVVDLGKSAVHGHFLLDLNKEYGTTGGHLKSV